MHKILIYLANLDWTFVLEVFLGVFAGSGLARLMFRTKLRAEQR